MNKKFIALIGAILIGAGGYFYFAGNAPAEAPAEGAAPQAMPISTAQAFGREVTEWSEFSGRLRAVEDVQIRPRVSGTVDEVLFKEGDTVEKGARLFTIDMRPFRAAYAQAEAALAATKARSALNSNEVQRTKKLLDEKAASQKEYDERVNASLEADAAVKAAKAQLQLAQLDLEYAEIKAPISGRVGRPEITVGNTVQAGQSVLTTIQSVDPVYADFDMDEQTYLRVVKQVRGENKSDEMPVYMALADEKEFTREGRIRSFDNQLAEDSGTIRVRAEFPNTDGILTPGLFARVRIGGADKQSAVLINDAAIGTDQDRKFVYTVAEDGTVGYRPVVLGSVHEGMRAITSGLAAGEKIIVNGLMRVHPGMKVQAMEVSMETLKPADVPAAETPAPEAAAPETTEQPAAETEKPAEEPQQ